MPTQKPTPDWLEDIQNRSWEPELFVSGGAIFFLLQVTDYLSRQGFILLQKTGYYEPVLIANFVIAALNALIFGFAIHLISRALWVAAITLSYVFPEGILTDETRFPPPFKQKIEKVQNTHDWVIRMETVSSLLFTLAFFFAMIILGVLITLLVLVPHQGLKEALGESYFYGLQIFAQIGLGLGVVYMIDFFSLGWVKKQRLLARLYYPIYVFFSVLTLAPLYRTTYYTLVSNIRAWRLILIVVGYVSVAALFTIWSRAGSLDVLFDPSKYIRLASTPNRVESRYYENLRPTDEMVVHLSIQSDIVNENYLRLFIVHQRAVEKLMRRNCSADNGAGQAMMDCYADFYKVFIDDAWQKHLRWQQYIHPQTSEEGLLAYVPIKDLSTNEHILRVVVNVSSEKDLRNLRNFGIRGGTYGQVYFWKN
ncbi:MAG: hypothetical protein OHK0053_16650 [Microscillaceae bacterium]